MFDLLVLPDFIDATTRQALLDELRVAGGALAPVYGGSSATGAVEPRVRNVNRIVPSEETRAVVSARLREALPIIARRFDVALASFEEPQFLRYVPGDFFVAHQDGNTSLINDDTRFRRISVSIFLNDGYEGGALVFHGPFPRYHERETAPAAPGTLIAFRSETTHEVTPVTAGERYTVVTWFR